MIVIDPNEQNRAISGHEKCRRSAISFLLTFVCLAGLFLVHTLVPFLETVEIYHVGGTKR